MKMLDWFSHGSPHAPLDNLKFATWRFELTPVWVDNVLVRKWLIAGMAYFEPISCEPEKSRNALALEKGFLEASMVNNNRIMGQMPPMGLSEADKGPATSSSVLAKALEVMRGELRKCGFPN
jgi:hypothetical protein